MSMSQVLQTPIEKEQPEYIISKEVEGLVSDFKVSKSYWTISYSIKRGRYYLFGGSKGWMKQTRLVYRIILALLAVSSLFLAYNTRITSALYARLYYWTLKNSIMNMNLSVETSGRTFFTSISYQIVCEIEEQQLHLPYKLQKLAAKAYKADKAIQKLICETLPVARLFLWDMPPLMSKCVDEPNLENQTLAEEIVNNMDIDDIVAALESSIKWKRIDEIEPLREFIKTGQVKIHGERLSIWIDYPGGSICVG